MNWWILAASVNQAAAPAHGAAGWASLLPMVVFFAIFYFILIMPQRKKQKQHNEMLKNLKKGDKVITIGGIHGEVVEFDDDDLKLRVSDKVEIKFSRSAIQKVKP